VYRVDAAFAGAGAATWPAARAINIGKRRRHSFFIMKVPGWPWVDFAQICRQ
jgi:hypothetical protein